MFFFHLGDESGIVLTRAPERKRSRAQKRK